MPFASPRAIRFRSIRSGFDRSRGTAAAALGGWCCAAPSLPLLSVGQQRPPSLISFNSTRAAQRAHTHTITVEYTHKQSKPRPSHHRTPTPLRTGSSDTPNTQHPPLVHPSIRPTTDRPTVHPPSSKQAAMASSRQHDTGSGGGGLAWLLQHSFDAALSWEHPTPDRLKLNACLFFAAFLCSLGVGLSSSLKARTLTRTMHGWWWIGLDWIGLGGGGVN